MSLTNALKNPTTGEITVPAHQLAAALQLWAEGLITRAQALQGASVPADAHDDVDALATVYQGKTNDVAKLAYLNRLERCAIVLQDDLITPAQFETFMEIV